MYLAAHSDAVQTILGRPYWQEGTSVIPADWLQMQSHHEAVPINRIPAGRAWTGRPSFINITGLQGDRNGARGGWENPSACSTCASANVEPNHPCKEGGFLARQRFTNRSTRGGGEGGKTRGKGEGEGRKEERRRNKEDNFKERL